MATFRVVAKRVTEFEDTVEAETLEEAHIKVTEEWLDDDFTPTESTWTIEVL